MMNKAIIEGLVSVIIPAYNAEHYISETLNSVLNQTYKNIEIIIVDDHSTDHTLQIIHDYKNKYQNITLYRQLKNQGVGAARNKGIQLANGQYISFVDSDDLWEEKKLEKQIELLKEVDGAFAYTAIKMIDKNGIEIKGKRKVKKCINYKFLLRNTMIATSSVLVDISKKGRFQMPSLRNAEDYATWLMLLRDGTSAYGINEALVKYRKREGSLSFDKRRAWKSVYDIQVNYENIPEIKAIINCFFYCLNAFKKYFL